MSPEPQSFSWANIALAFTVVFGLLAALGFILKYVGMRGLRLPGMPARSRRLAVVESMPLDARRRLVIVRCDGNEHLLLLGGNQDILVEPSLAARPDTKGNP